MSPATDIGFLIQARDATETLESDSTIWGKWIVPTEELPRYKTLYCKRSKYDSNQTLFEVIALMLIATYCKMTNLVEHYYLIIIMHVDIASKHYYCVLY